MGKLKGKPQEWLYWKPAIVAENIDCLILELKKRFDSNENKMAVRKQFEEKKKKIGEPFVEYYDEKKCWQKILKIKTNK